MCEDFFFFIKISLCFFQMVGKRSSRDYTHAIHMCGRRDYYTRSDCCVYDSVCGEGERIYDDNCAFCFGESSESFFFSDLL